jgi:mRNA interferase HicA
VYHEAAVKSSEFKRWLAKQGVTFGSQEGSHLRLYHQGRISVLPMHAKDLGKGLVETIKKQLGLKGKE